ALSHLAHSRSLKGRRRRAAGQRTWLGGESVAAAARRAARPPRRDRLARAALRRADARNSGPPVDRRARPAARRARPARGAPSLVMHRVGLRSLFIGAVLAVLPASAQDTIASPPPRPTREPPEPARVPFGVGERLEYQVKYKGISVG